MLTAIFENKKYYSLDENWYDRKEEMRKLLNNKAVCPLCKEPVICKFGEEKIHHFAHSQRGNCPSTNDTEKHMKGVGLLYQNFLTNIDQYGLSHVSVDRVFEEEQFVADLELQFRDGKRLIIEYYAGQLKKNDIVKRNKYYDKMRITVIWVIDSDLLEYVHEYIKVKPTLREMKKVNEVDKIYIDNWRTSILGDEIITEIPKKKHAYGTIIFLDANNTEVRILRALRKYKHAGLYKPRKDLSGKLSEVQITKDHETLFFEEERKTGEMFKEKSLIIKKKNAKAKEEHKKAEEEHKRAKEQRRVTFEKQQLNLFNVQQSKGQIDEKWQQNREENEIIHNIHAEKSKEEIKEEIESNWFHCRLCRELKKEKEMYTYSYGSKSGVCNVCQTKG